MAGLAKPKIESVDSRQARHLAVLESRQAARREYLRSVAQMITLRQRELDNLRAAWSKEDEMNRQSTLERPLEWASDGFEYVADGLTGEFSLLPYRSPVDGSDRWILRGRRFTTRRWNYFGSHESLDEAQRWASTADSRRVLFFDLEDGVEDD